MTSVKKLPHWTPPWDYWDGLGIKTASHIFQIAIEKILFGKVDNIIIYQDDICLGAAPERN